jgi:hypothetical protein
LDLKTADAQTGVKTVVAKSRVLMPGRKPVVIEKDEGA